MQDKLHVLIVEDDPIIARLIQSDLIDGGYVVAGIAHDGDVALDLIYTQKPQLILLDINIDGARDGIDIGAIVQEKYNIPFIYLTALFDADTLERAKATSPCAYIVKPYKASDLYSAIIIGLDNFQYRQKDKTLSIQDVNRIAVEDLTNKEFDILRDLTEGLTNAQIANQQNVSANTIKWHLQKIYSKLAVRNRTTAVQLVLNS